MPLAHREDKQGDVHYLEGLLAVDIHTLDPQDRSSLRAQVSDRVGAETVDPGRLAEELGDSEMVSAVTRIVDIFEVDDPVAAAGELSGLEGLTASPIHGLGFSWHSAYSATRPTDHGDLQFPESPPGRRDRVIAVVDTGIVAPGALPGWMTSSLIHGRADVEAIAKGGVSHGTFVTSLIRQIAPDHVISVARSAPYRDDGKEPGDAEHPSPAPTTEFHVANALLRLVDRHRGGGGVEALNLSVGGPSLGKRPMALIQAALAYWRQQFPHCVVFAAAGNSDRPDPIYPAAFRHVRGVGAGQGGSEIVWASGAVQPISGRNWVDDVAPGDRLIGLSGRGPADAIDWSGSSFASAVATASYVLGGPVETRGRISYWPNRSISYGDVPGLMFA